MPGWSLPAQFPPVIARSMTAGFFSGSILIDPSSVLAGMVRVYLSALNDHVASMGTVFPNWTHDSIFQSPSSFLRSDLSSFSFKPGAADADRPARHAIPTASKTNRVMGHLRGDTGPLYAAGGRTGS